MAVEVRARLDGFYKGSRIRAGSTFFVADGTKLGKWMEPVTKAEKPAAKPAPVKNGNGKKADDNDALA